jgi:nitroreductase
MHTNTPTAQADTRAVADGLAEAAAAAGYAPSIHDTQPWQWSLGGDALDLYLDRSRVLDVIDPDTRLATLSCGAALHHARTVVSAEGWGSTVTRMPDAADQNHLAHLHVDGPALAEPQAVRHVRTIPLRHTDRRPVTGAPVGSEDLRAVMASVVAEGAWLFMLSAHQVVELAAAAAHAQRAEAADPAWQSELAYWTAGTRPAGTGRPDAALPQIQTLTTVSAYGVGQQDDLPITAQRDRAALFAILYGHSDEPRDWLRAGEALSAGWLTATERGISVLPLSAPVQVIGTRDTMRRLLSYLHHPYLVLRFGTTDRASADTPHAPRLPADQTVERHR